MRWDHPAMTITEVIPNLWQGACPHLDSDFSSYGVGTLVYVLRSEVPTSQIRFTGCEWVHIPLVDDPNVPCADPPNIVGTTLQEMNALAKTVVDRVRLGRPTIALCQWGYNRSGFLVGLAMRQLGYSASDTLDKMRASRGPHPMGYGPALNNHTFRHVVEAA